MKSLHLKEHPLTADERCAMWRELRRAMWSRDLDVLCDALYHDHAALAMRVEVDNLTKNDPPCFRCAKRGNTNGYCAQPCNPRPVS